MVILYCTECNNVDFNKQIKEAELTHNKPYKAGQQGCLLLKGQVHLNIPYYALIIPNAFSNLLCSILCWHNVHRPICDLTKMY